MGHLFAIRLESNITPKIARKQSWHWNGRHTPEKTSKTCGLLRSGSWLVDPDCEARRRRAAVRWLKLLAIQADLSIFELHGESYTASWTEEAPSRAWYSTLFDICIRSSYTAFVLQILQEAAFVWWRYKWVSATSKLNLSQMEIGG